MPLKAKILRRYQYKDLSSSDSFRLVELLPGSGDQRLRCRLITTHLSHMPHFEAISYVWGNRLYISSIICDEKLLWITTSLQEVLQRFRDCQKSRILWIDAICINQKNPRERSHQIRLMAKIYGLASHVLIWLGKDQNNNAEDNFSLISEVIQLYDHRQRMLGSIAKAARLHPNELGTFKNERWISLSRTLKCPWFTRVWVIQEVGCASQATIFMGQSQISWTELMKFLSWLYRQAMCSGTTYYIAIDSILYPWLSYDTTRDTLDILTITSKREPSFLEILDLARERECLDPRDRIYAFLDHPELKRRKTSLLIEPSYSSDTVEVYYNFVVNWLQHNKSAYVLSFVFHPDSSTIYNEFPTFVVQWDVRNPTEVLNPAPRRNGYNATKSSTLDTRVLPNRLLDVNGLAFDTIEFCSGRLDWEQTPTHSQAPAFLEVWKHLFKEVKVRATPYEDDYRAFALTLTAGQLSDNIAYGKLADDHSERHFASFSAYWIQILDSTGHSEYDIPMAIRQAAKDGQGESFARTASYMCHFRRFFCTRKGYFGLGPTIIQPGDLCCLFFGAEVPYNLKLLEDGSFNFLGECYIHGIMHGEAMDMLHGGELEKTEFVLS